MNNSSFQNEKTIGYKEMSLGNWLLTLLLVSIPVVNLVMLCIWGFGEDNPRKNFSRAYLIWIAIVFVISVVIWIIMFVIIASIGGGYYY